MSFRKFGTGQIIPADPEDDEAKDEQTETIDQRNTQAGADLEQDEE